MGRPASTAMERIAAVERLRAAGWTAAAACAAAGISPSSYYRARPGAGASPRGRRKQPPAPRPVGLHRRQAHWPPPAKAGSDWLSLAPPWRAPDDFWFSPFAVLKPILRRPPPRPASAPVAPTISAELAPVIDRMAADAVQPLRLRASLGHRTPRRWHGALDGLAAAPAWLARAAPIAALAAIALIFGAALMQTAAHPAAMHLSTAAAEARMVAGGE